MKYAIFWKNSLCNGSEHHGDYCLDKKNAQDFCNKLNRQYPAIYHWFEADN